MYSGASLFFCFFLKKVLTRCNTLVLFPSKMGKRADTRTITSIALDIETLKFLQSEAARRNTNVSNLLEELAKNLQEQTGQPKEYPYEGKNKNKKSR